MKLKDMSFEDLEAMSYDDIALMVLKEKNKGLKINDLFKEVCKLLKLTDDEFVEKLPAFFDVISTDHRFTMLENGLWDLRTKHSTKIVIDNDEEEEEIIDDIDEETEEEEKEEDEEIFYDEETDDDEPEDDLKDLVIIDEDEASELS